MPAVEQGVLKLEGVLDAFTVPALLSRTRKAAGVTAIDLSAVGEVDSAGVAFVRYLQVLLSSDKGERPQLQGIPARFEQLCQAHRVPSRGE